MNQTNAYYRISAETPCCLNCRHFECHYTTDDELRFYPAAYGLCTYNCFRVRGVAEHCKNYKNRHEERVR